MNKRFKNIDVLDQKEINKNFIDCCRNGDLAQIKYMFTSKDLFIKPDIYHTEENYDGITHAGANGHLDVVKYLMTSKDLEKNARFNIFYYDYLSLICEASQFHVADYLLKQNVFVPEIAFINTHEYATKPNLLSEYLIINCDIPITPSVKKIIDKSPLIAEMFNRRELHKELNNTLEVSDILKKKPKL
jgi:hypothetical protein